MSKRNRMKKMDFKVWKKEDGSIARVQAAVIDNNRCEPRRKDENRAAIRRARKEAARMENGN